MLCTAMAVGPVGRRPDECTGHGNESRYGHRGKYHQEKERSHGLFDTAYQSKCK